jgi:phosphopantetheine--protein transferase-like protein
MKNAICFEDNKNIIFHTHPGDSSALLPGEVHLWLATIDHVPELSLSVAEQMTLSAMKLPLAARRFESTRKLLRYLLGAYLKCPDGHIEKTDQGKPFLPEFPEFHFNVTHSKKMIIVALSRGPVGVDLERIRKLDVIPVAKRFFSPQELFFLQEENQEQNQQTFFKLWTAKEAALKADGGGIAFGMKNNIATMKEGNVSSITFKRQSWKICSWSLCEKSEFFFGAIATLFVPSVIHWYDLRTFDRISR